MPRSAHIDFALDDRIEALVESGRLERGSAAYGIAQLAIHFGADSLLPMQRALYEVEITPLLGPPVPAADSIAAH